MAVFHRVGEQVDHQTLEQLVVAAHPDVLLLIVVEAQGDAPALGLDLHLVDGGFDHVEHVLLHHLHGFFRLDPRQLQELLGDIQVALGVVLDVIEEVPQPFAVLAMAHLADQRQHRDHRRAQVVGQKIEHFRAGAQRLLDVGNVLEADDQHAPGLIAGVHQNHIQVQIHAPPVAALFLHPAVGEHLLEQPHPVAVAVEFQLAADVRQPQGVLADAFQAEQIGRLGVDEDHPAAGVADQHALAHLRQTDLEKAGQRLLALLLGAQPFDVLLDHLVAGPAAGAARLGAGQHGADPVIVGVRVKPLAPGHPQFVALAVVAERVAARQLAAPVHRRQRLAAGHRSAALGLQAPGAYRQHLVEHPQHARHGRRLGQTAVEIAVLGQPRQGVAHVGHGVFQAPPGP